MPPRCHFCQKECTDNDYCYGCRHHVCAECDKENGELGRDHEVEVHRVVHIDGKPAS